MYIPVLQDDGWQWVLVNQLLKHLSIGGGQPTPACAGVSGSSMCLSDSGSKQRRQRRHSMRALGDNWTLLACATNKLCQMVQKGKATATSRLCSK
jgi:hypothetical protein